MCNTIPRSVKQVTCVRSMKIGEEKDTCTTSGHLYPIVHFQEKAFVIEDDQGREINVYLHSAGEYFKAANRLMY